MSVIRIFQQLNNSLPGFRVATEQELVTVPGIPNALAAIAGFVLPAALDIFTAGAMSKPATIRVAKRCMFVPFRNSFRFS